MNDQTREIRLNPQPDKKRSHWYLLTGLVLGVAVGLIYAWLINPVVYQDTTPRTLSESYKEIYRRIIAEVFAATGDLERATSRLSLLEDENEVFALGAQAQRALSEGREEEAHALALLASAIQSGQPTGESIPTIISPSEAPNEPSIPTQTLPKQAPEP